MGQVQSRFERPGGFWHRRKPQIAARGASQESFIQMSPPPPEPDQSSVQMDQSSTTANTTPASAAPKPSKLPTQDDAMADNSDSKPDELETVKVEQRAPTPCGQPTTTDQPTQPTQSAEKPTPNRPALKREFTPPHRIQIWNTRAWQTEKAYSNVHDHVTRTLDEIRAQQVESNRRGPNVRKIEQDIYKAADSCTLSLEYLVGHFSTRFFHHAGPENILGMMATIAADAAALDELRLRQLHLFNYSYNLEKKIIQTEGDIRQLAELAKRLREVRLGEEDEGEEEEEEEDEDEDEDADGDSDPEVDGQGDCCGNGHAS